MYSKTKKFCLILLVAMMILICAATFIACSSNNNNNSNNEQHQSAIDFLRDAFTFEQAYAYATDLGFYGTLDDFIEMLSGKDGRDGIDGRDGTDGQDGVGILWMEAGYDHHLYVMLTNGERLDLGALPQGPKGEDGTTPTIEIDVDGYWVINGEFTGIKAQGEDGKDGENGKDGETPMVEVNTDGYWVINGEFTGIKAQGEDGKDGENGKDGANGVDGKDGANGVNGKDGENGKSAFELYKEKVGYEGTEQEWLDDLVNGRLGTADLYTVTFVSGCDDEYENLQVKGGKTVSAPVEPTKSGYIFAGWYVEGVQWLFPVYTVEQDITLTAKWIPNNCTVVFDANNGSSCESKEYTIGENVELPVTTRHGYDFAGWYYGGDLCENGVWNIMSNNIALIAHWTSTQYAINYHLNGGTNNVSNPATYTIEQSVTFAAPSKTGYTFVGWYAEDTFDNAVTSITLGSTGAIDVYAKFAANTYTVTFDSAGGTSFDSMQVTFDSNVVLPTPENGVLTFMGWHLNDTLVESGAWKISESVTLTAQWLLFENGFVGELLEGDKVRVIEYRGNGAELTIPATICTYSVSTVGTELFRGNSAVTSVYISDGITVIEDSAFENCSNLKTVRFATGMTTYGDNVLLGCANLESISIDVINQVLIGFFDYNNSNIPESFKSITLQAHANTAAKMFQNITDHTFSVTLDSSWTTIPENQFKNVSVVDAVLIPDSVTSIEDSAFHNCDGLTSIIIPDNVEGDIGDYAFTGCDNLTSVTIGNGVTGIGYYAFYNCSGLTSVTIPDSVTSIRMGAFDACSSLTSVMIPDSVTSIGVKAFWGCSSLTEIRFNGTRAEWYNIEFGANWDANSGAYTVYCTDGTISKNS